jgi:hypothetical protein
VTVKLEQDLAPMDQCNSEEQVRSRLMKWIISFNDWLVHVLHQHRRRWNGMRKAKV